MAAVREVYKETYRKGAAVVRESLLPDSLPYMDKAFRVSGIEIRAAGKMADGREFQDVRVYSERRADENNDRDAEPAGQAQRG